jgi:hypothetical protein
LPGAVIVSADEGILYQLGAPSRGNVLFDHLTVDNVSKVDSSL